MMFSSSHRVLFLFVTMTIPPEWVCSLLWVCVNLKFGPYWAFRVWIWELSKWDSSIHRMAMLLECMVHIIPFHLSCVEYLLAPLMFRVAIVMEAALGGGCREPPHRYRGFLG